MEIKGKVYCLFEQSGTFKNEFRKLGIPAEDYDIRNNFGQTDHVVDLFAEIDSGGGLFDEITKNDLIMAFFPCIYFCENNTMIFSGTHMNRRNHSRSEINDYILQRSRERQRFYELILKMFDIVERKGLRMVVENPYSEHHYLTNNFPYKPSVIDKDRTRRGDYFVKPTQYWFVNCEPTIGMSFQKPKMRLNIQKMKPSREFGLCSEERSMIAPDYARNFICDFILGKEQIRTQLELFNV